MGTFTGFVLATRHHALDRRGGAVRMDVKCGALTVLRGKNAIDMKKAGRQWEHTVRGPQSARPELPPCRVALDQRRGDGHGERRPWLRSCLPTTPTQRQPPLLAIPFSLHTHSANRHVTTLFPRAQRTFSGTQNGPVDLQICLPEGLHLEPRGPG